MANQDEVRDVYGYFEQKGNALSYRYEAERVRIEPWGADSLRVRAWKTAEMDPADWALIKPEKEITPEIDVGTIASMEVAAAWRCDSPSHTSTGTITVPPPMPNMPDNRPTIMPTITSTIMP